MLSKKTQYAIQALIVLTHAEGRAVATAEIIRKKNLPRKFLESILRELKFAGILSSRKGKYGGYTLARNPKEISIGDVMTLLEGDRWLKCSHADKGGCCKSCTSAETCIVKLVAGSMRKQLSSWFTSHSIADIAAEEEELLLSTAFS